MDIADLILRYLQTLAWPIVVLVFVVMFRRSIRSAVGRLTEVTGPGVSAKFETEAEALAVRAKEVADRQPAGPCTPHVLSPPPREPQPSYGPPWTPRTGDVQDGPAEPSEVEGRPSEDIGHTASPASPAQPSPPQGPDAATPPLSPEEVRSRVRAKFAVARSAAASDPAVAVASAWLAVQCTIEDMTGPATSRVEQTVRLAGMGVSAEVQVIVRDLDAMRGDIAAHPEAVTSAAARAYVTSAEEIVSALYLATGRTP